MSCFPLCYIQIIPFLCIFSTPFAGYLSLFLVIEETYFIHYITIVSRLFSPLLRIHSTLFSHSLTSAHICSNFTIFCYDSMVQMLVFLRVFQLSFLFWPCILCIFNILSYYEAQSYSLMESPHIFSWISPFQNLLSSCSRQGWWHLWLLYS